MGKNKGNTLLKKDDMLKLEIQDMGIDGEGIGKVDGITLFVKDAVIGDTIMAKVMKMKKNYGYARMMEILEPSPYRVEPKCEFHRQCGGCQLQPLDYKKQLEFKENKVRNNLIRIGGFENAKELMEPIIGMEAPYYYRNKAQFPIGKDKEGNIVTGFYASRTHSIIPNRNCYLGADVNKQVLDIVIDFMESNGIEPYDEKTGRGFLRHVLIRKGFSTGEIMVCLVVNGKRLPFAEVLVKKLCAIEGMTSITLNVNQKNTNVILGEELILLWGQDYITDTIGDIKYQISPLAFYQVNPVQTEKLYQTALEYAGLTGQETVWDLYCGIGTISLFLAQKAKQVNGVEIVPQAIENAKNNAVLNNIHNAEFFVGKAEEVLPEFYERESKKAAGKTLHGKAEDILVDSKSVEIAEKKLVDSKKIEIAEKKLVDSNSVDVADSKNIEVVKNKQIDENTRSSMLYPDVIVVDPPRKGCDEKCLETIVKMQPQRVVYVSCDSATLARDLKYLCEYGYELKKVRPVDMFPQTVGIENVCLLIK